MNRAKVLSSAIMIAVLLLSALGLSPGTALAAKGSDAPKADPRLLELAAAHPADTFQIIVQQDLKKQDLSEAPDAAVEHAGGRVHRNKKMDFIGGFSAELSGKDILKLARHPRVHWVSLDAPVLMQGGFGSYTYRDEFPAVGYAGTNGTDSWAALPWTEVGEADGASAGLVRVVSAKLCASLYYCLRIGAASNVYGAPVTLTSIAGVGVSRKARLAGATGVVLTFSVRRQVITPTNGVVYLQVSPDGYYWSTLDVFYLNASDSAPVAKAYDFSGYSPMPALPMFRFLGDGVVNGYLYVDSMQIEYTRLANSYDRTTQSTSVWANTAAPGSGVTVAVVDSGISDHPDFYTGSASRLLASVDFSGKSIPGEPVGFDDYGHGTHVAGIIAGAGQASQGARIGNAPAVSLVNVKVSGPDGSCYISNVIAGLQWIYDNRNAYNIKVVNLSLNSAVPESYNTSALDAAVEILWFNGITVVVSAGNNGTGTGPVPLVPPANDPFVITVGATDDMGTAGVGDDYVPAFSAYGTTENGFAKPDLVAPGRNIISPLASTASTAYAEHPANRVDNYYFRMSGTSMAAPMVSGAVALLLQQDPSLTPDQVKYRIKSTASTAWAGYDPVRAGAGQLNAYAAVYGSSTASSNTGIDASAMLSTGSVPAVWTSVGWNSVGWNTVGWNSVGWNTVGWNTVGWNTVGWNTVGWNTSIWDP